MVEPTLFSQATAPDIDALEVTFTERVVRDFWITIAGRRFDAEDIYNTLQETCEGDHAYMNDQKMIDALKSIHVIIHGGSSRWAMSAEKGPNYDKFMAHLTKHLRKLESDVV